MTRLDERSKDAKRGSLVKHTLHQALDRIFRSAKGSQARHTQRTGCAAEDQIPSSHLAFPFLPSTSFPEVGQRQLDDVQGAPEVRLELIADLVFVLIFARAHDAVAGAVGYDVDAAPVREGLFVDGGDGLADADVAEEGEVGRLRGGFGVVELAGGGRDGVEFLHAGEVIVEGAADCCDQVRMGEGGFDDGAAHVACCSEDLHGTSVMAQRVLRAR